MEIIVSESTKISYEQKEIALDYIVQMLRIPGFPIELYLNYDSCLNFSNLFEDLSKLLSKVIILYFSFFVLYSLASI
jgi:brefeldin A-resistance guanine nucleotide exchange factor 1